MSESGALIVVGILSLIGTITGSWMGVRQANKLVVWRIDILEKKMEKHNNIVERLALVEASSKSAHKRIDRIDEIVDASE